MSEENKVRDKYLELRDEVLSNRTSETGRSMTCQLCGQKHSFRNFRINPIPDDEGGAFALCPEKETAFSEHTISHGY